MDKIEVLKIIRANEEKFKQHVERIQLLEEKERQLKINTNEYNNDNVDKENCMAPTFNEYNYEDRRDYPKGYMPHKKLPTFQSDNVGVISNEEINNNNIINNNINNEYGSKVKNYVFNQLYNSEEDIHNDINEEQNQISINNNKHNNLNIQNNEAEDNDLMYSDDDEEEEENKNEIINDNNNNNVNKDIKIEYDQNQNVPSFLINKKLNDNNIINNNTNKETPVIQSIDPIEDIEETIQHQPNTNNNNNNSKLNAFLNEFKSKASLTNQPNNPQLSSQKKNISTIVHHFQSDDEDEQALPNYITNNQKQQQPQPQQDDPFTLRQFQNADIEEHIPNNNMKSPEFVSSPQQSQNVIKQLNPRKFSTVAKENISKAMLDNLNKKQYTAYTYSTIQKKKVETKPKKSKLLIYINYIV